MGKNLSFFLVLYHSSESNDVHEEKKERYIFHSDIEKRENNENNV